MENYLLKMSGAGNRFLLADEKFFGKKTPLEWGKHFYRTNKKFESFKQLAEESPSHRKIFLKKLLSVKELSLADGLVIAQWRALRLFCDFYNKDGSRAGFCGNAACCVSVYAKGMSPSLKTFRLGRERVSCAKGGGIVFKKKPGSIFKQDCTFNGEPIQWSFVNTGVPHGVIRCSSASSVSFKNKSQLKELAQSLRFKNVRGYQGMNVSFFQIVKKGAVQAITYERGVEDFTLACGTGALAVAWVFRQKRPELKSLLVQMPGGQLKVQFKPQLALFSPVKKGF